jgi:hypothetical protein
VAHPPNSKVFNLIKPQADFIKSTARYPAYVAGWGTGKSMCLISKAMMLSENYKNNLGVIFRKEYTDLRDSTIRDFEDYTGIKINSNRAAVLSNGSQILFRHLEEMNNIQNMNLGWFGIEQAEELDTDEQFFKLHGRLRRESVDRCGFIIANTNGHNWIYKLWKVARDPAYPLFEATSFDAVNYLPKDTIESWRQLEQKKPKLYRRFILNSWDDADTTDIVILPELVEAAKKRTVRIHKPLRRIVSIDVARFGDDATVFYALEGDDKCARVLGKEYHEKKDTMDTVGRAQVFAKKHGDIQSYAVDEIGIGGGVVDRLKELDKHVIPVCSSERKLVPPGYYNRRAEIYITGAEAFENGTIQLLPDDEDLAEELSWTRYKPFKSTGVFQLEPKEDVKDRHGRSPDHADSFLNGLWALKKAVLAQTKPKSKPYRINRLPWERP